MSDDLPVAGPEASLAADGLPAAPADLDADLDADELLAREVAALIERRARSWALGSAELTRYLSRPANVETVAALMEHVPGLPESRGVDLMQRVQQLLRGGVVAEHLRECRDPEAHRELLGWHHERPFLGLTLPALALALLASAVIALGMLLLARALLPSPQPWRLWLGAGLGAGALVGMLFSTLQRREARRLAALERRISG